MTVLNAVGGLVLTDRYQEMSMKAAKAVASQLKQKPNSALGLPTGRSPVGCYKLLSDWTRAGNLDWSKANCFALDDYLHVQEEFSFARFLEDHLFKNVSLPEKQKHNPCWVDNYDGEIAQAGGLDLVMIGIGRNGHIAFNEPGTPVTSWTHCSGLTESTRQANASMFPDANMVPSGAISIGLSTILSARKVILLVSGEIKRDIVIRSLSGPITTEVPASCLQTHPNLKVFADFELPNHIPQH